VAYTGSEPASRVLVLVSYTEETMMDAATQATLPIFLLQVFLLSAYIPISYIAYRWACAPKKHLRVREALLDLGMPFAQMGQQARVYEYSTRDYSWPVFIAWFVTVLTFSLTHPYPIALGLWDGILEESVNIFGVDDPEQFAILAGRFLFYGWSGAVAYSLFMIGRRFLDYDLTPRVYIYTATRFTLAFVIGAVVGVLLGVTTTAAGTSFDLTLSTVAVVAFVIGFFPERGWEFLSQAARASLRQSRRDSKEVRLSAIEGMSIFQQGRLRQDGIENVQNLAAANVPALVANTPFSVGQLIDWIDQAILLVYTSDDQSRALAKLGIIRASDVLANTLHDDTREALISSLGEKKADALQISEVIGNTVSGFNPEQAAQALAEVGKIETRAIDAAELAVLTRGLQSALNMELVTYYRWKTSLNKALRDHVEEHADAVATYHTPTPAPAEATPLPVASEAASPAM
jgi:hypothetical protein